MSLFAQLFNFGQSTRSGSIENPSIPLSQVTLDDLFGDGYTTDSGEGVSHGRALGYAPVYQAVGMISGGCAKLPLGVFRRLPNNGRQYDTKHPAEKLISLTGSPNAEINAFKFWRRYYVSALLWSNAYAWIERNVRGQPIGIYHLLSDRTCMERRGGRLCCITEVGGKLWELAESDVLHIEGVSIDGLQGADLVRMFRQDFGLALAARKFTSKFFGQGANVGGILQVPPSAKPEAVRKVQGSIAEKFTGGGQSFKTLVLRDGFKWFATQVDPNKASVDRIDERQTIHVAQMFQLDPSRLGVKGSVSYNSRETAKQDYHDDALSPWLIGTKSECNRKLLSDDEREADSHFIDYNINALLWADAKSRASIAREGILSGRLTINETRAWENLNPVPGGDDLLLPLNMVRIDAVTGQPKSIDPKATEAKSRDKAPKGDDASADLRRLLEITLRRIHGRLANQATKIRGAARGPRVADLIRSQRAQGIEILEVPLRVIGHLIRSIDAAQVWDRYTAELLERSIDDETDLESIFQARGDSLSELAANLLSE